MRGLRQVHSMNFIVLHSRWQTGRVELSIAGKQFELFEVRTCCNLSNFTKVTLVNVGELKQTAGCNLRDTGQIPPVSYRPDTAVSIWQLIFWWSAPVYGYTPHCSICWIVSIRRNFLLHLWTFAPEPQCHSLSLPLWSSNSPTDCSILVDALNDWWLTLVFTNIHTRFTSVLKPIQQVGLRCLSKRLSV